MYANPDAELRALSERGLSVRYGRQSGRIIPDAARKRLAFELEVVGFKFFASYILTVYRLAQQRRTCGRGSAASSIICYCLGLTNVDPIRYHLVFERFLAPEREDPPDIDLDFPWDERDDVFAAAIEYYGHGHVAMVSTHLHYRQWSAMREVARVHGKKRDDISAVKRQLSQIHHFGGQAVRPESWKNIFHEAQSLCGKPRHYGLHPGGLIITEGPIQDIVPTHLSKKIIAGRPLPAIAWEKNGAEAMGLVKIDILGNRSLAVIRDTLADLAEDGITINEKRWHPQDDVATRQLIASGATMGCFYIESPAMRQLNAKAGSGDFDRLIVHSSIIRPAANRWINEYLTRLHAFNKTGVMDDGWYLHPILKNLLSESFGILSYQEDVMMVAKELAGFTSREQNYLRKSLGKSDTRERLQVLAQRFVAGCAEKGVADDVVEHVWSMISSFAGYSFCKAHSASYAMISFQCAYLKAHHPAYFLARVISNGGGYYDRGAYIEEARRQGVRIYAPCVLRSAYATRHVHGGTGIRLGLDSIPHLHRYDADGIVQEAQSQPFQSFTDFYHRCPLSLRVCRILEHAGAFNFLLRSHNNAQRVWIIENIYRSHAHQLSSHAGCQQTVSDFAQQDPVPPSTLQAAKPLDIWRTRFSVLGCLPYAHPLCLWPQNQRRACYRCCDITAASVGKRCQVRAWSIASKHVRATRKKDRDGTMLEEPGHQAMAFVTLEDETAILESTWFPEVYLKYGSCLAERQPMWIHGIVRIEFGFVSLEVQRVENDRTLGKLSLRE